MEILNLGSHRIGVRFPEKGMRKGKNPAILLNDGKLIEQLNLRTERAVLVGVYPNNRLSEYTPWPEPAIRPGAPDFWRAARTISSRTEQRNSPGAYRRIRP